MNKTNLIYGVTDKVPFWKNLLFAFQQFLAIIAATILVPVLVNGISGTNYLNQPSALIGAGAGTLIYLLFTRFKSPVFLGSSFAFINPLVSATMFGYFGIFLGAVVAGLVYVVIAIVIKFVGAGWITKLMPPVIIGPTVALIGLSLAGSAMNNVMNTASSADNYNLLSILVGVVTFFVTILASVKGGKQLKLFPFVVGVLGGYVFACLITGIGMLTSNPNMVLVSFEPFAKIADFSNWIPNLTFVGLIKEGTTNMTLEAIISITLTFAPIALVVFAEHVADHKNISSIIGSDLLEDPGLHRTLLGDGVGSMVGSFFGGCPNTTYGESVGCVAITGNASVRTIFTAAIICFAVAFFYPALALVESISSCSAIVGGICIALYGFIAVSGLRMFKHVDLDNSKNLFIVAAILIPGIGGLTLNLGPYISITSIACGLILGILVNLVLKPGKAEVKKEVTYEKETENNMFGTQVKED